MEDYLLKELKFFDHQIDSLNKTEHCNRVAYYHDMGLGKTFTGAEKMMRLGAKINLVVCQKSKVDDWIEHFKTHYDILPYDLTNKNHFGCFILDIKNDATLTEEELIFYHRNKPIVAVINYELAFRRPELKTLKDFTLLLDESSMVQNEKAKRSKFILNLNAKNVILLSGTPTSGKYENLWSQCRLLGWSISKKTYWNQYIETETLDNEGYPITVVRGYKNVERLKRKLREHGAIFLKTEDVLCLPEQFDQTIRVSTTKEYRTFKKDCIVQVHTKVFDHECDSEWDGKVYDDLHELVGDTSLTKMLYERQLCGQYNSDKLAAFRDLLESTNDRLIVFYNFTAEMKELYRIAHEEFDRACSLVNGEMRNLEAYEHCDDSVTFIQYQAGAMGLNLQKANKIVYFTPPLSSELFEQSKKRIHRIGQQKPCFYYYLTCKNSIEEKIYETLAMRRDYTDALFEEGE